MIEGPVRDFCESSLQQGLLFVLYLCNCIDVSRGKSSYRTQIFHRVNTFSIQNPTILEKTMEFERNSNRRFAVKNKEIKQIIFSQKKNKKWIIVALVLVLTLGGGSVAAVTAAVLALKCRAVEGGDMTSASYYIIAGVEDNYAAISNLEMAIGDFLTEGNNESKEKVCVLGATVAKEIFGSGEYYLDGMAIHETKEDDLTMVRNQKIGFIFQNYQLI